MGRSIRKTYPEYVRYITRFDAGTLQKASGVPASLIHKLRRGEVRGISEKTGNKLLNVYNAYWTNRLGKSGVKESERKVMIRHFDVEKLRSIEKQNNNIARYISRHKDADKKGWTSRWHTKKEVLKGMAQSLRSQNDWLEYLRKKYKVKRIRFYGDDLDNLPIV